MLSLLLFLRRRLTSAFLRRHPYVRAVLALAAIVRWWSRRPAHRTQRLAVRPGETMTISVSQEGKRT